MIRIGSGEGLFVYLFVETSGAKFAGSFGYQFLWSCEQQIHFVPKNVRPFFAKKKIPSMFKRPSAVYKFEGFEHTPKRT